MVIYDGNELGFNQHLTNIVNILPPFQKQKGGREYKPLCFCPPFASQKGG